MSQYSFRIATGFLWASVSPSVIWAKSDQGSWVQVPAPPQLDSLPLPPSAGLLAWNLTAMVHPGAPQRPYSGGPGNSQSVPTLG